MTEDFWEITKYIIYSLFIFLKIPTDTMMVLMIIIGVDMFTGSVKVIFIPKVRFCFKTLFKGLMGKLMLLIIPMTVALLGIGLGYDIRWVVTTVIKLMMISEVVSILNNFIAMKEGKEIESKDYVYVLIKKIRKYIEKLFNKMLSGL